MTEIELPAPLQKLIERWPSGAFAVRFVWRLGERWGADRCALMAAALAFFGLLSLFPILLAAITILGRTLANRPDITQDFLNFAGQFFPGATGDIWRERATGEVAGLAEAAGGWLGLFSLLSLLWSGRAFFDTLGGILNTIWPGAQQRSWLGHQIALWGTFGGAAIFYALSLSTTFLLKTLHAISDRLPNFWFNRQPILWDILGALTSWALTLCMFWMIYRFLPNATRGIRGRRALSAAVIAAGALEIAKFAFATYLPDATRYGTIYGSLAGVIVTMMWLYVSSSIILLGAEVAAVWTELKRD